MKTKWVYMFSAFFMLIAAVLVGYILTISGDVASDSTSNQQFSGVEMTEGMEPVKNLIPKKVGDPNSSYEEKGFSKVLSPTQQNPPDTVEKQNSNETSEPTSDMKKIPQEALNDLVFSAADTQANPKNVKNKQEEGKASDKDVEAALSQYTESMSNDNALIPDFEINHDAQKTQKPLEKKQATDSTTAKPENNKVLVTKSGVYDRPKENVLTYMELRLDGTEVSLAIQGNKPLKAKVFSMEDPHRVVFDIEGVWVMKLPKVTNNRMLEALRGGSGDNYTRIVFDLKVKPQDVKITHMNDKNLRVVFK